MISQLKKIKTLPKYFLQLVKDLWIELFEFTTQAIEKSHDLIETNYKLGLHHLYLHNLSDAKLRFRITEYFKPGYKDALYHLARCYMYTNNAKKAKSILNRLLDNQKAKFRLDVLNKNIIEQIPIEILEEDFDYLSFNYTKLCDIEKYNAPFNTTQIIKQHISCNDNLSVLDIGAGNGDAGIIYRQNLNISELDAIDISKMMIKKIEELNNINNNHIYDQCFHTSLDNFITDKKYDLVIACCSLCYNNDLMNSFEKIQKLLKKNGYAAITLENAESNSNFDYLSATFTFSKQDILNIANLINFSIIAIQDIEIQKDTKGICIFLKN